MQQNDNRPAGERKIVSKLPHGWPSDKRTRRTDFKGKIILAHPDRPPVFSEDGKTWQALDATLETVKAMA